MTKDRLGKRVSENARQVISSRYAVFSKYQRCLQTSETSFRGQSIVPPGPLMAQGSGDFIGVFVPIDVLSWLKLPMNLIARMHGMDCNTLFIVHVITSRRPIRVLMLTVMAPGVCPVYFV